MYRPQQEITGVSEPQFSKSATVAAFAGIGCMVLFIFLDVFAKFNEPAHKILMGLKSWVS